MPEKPVAAPGEACGSSSPGRMSGIEPLGEMMTTASDAGAAGLLHILHPCPDDRPSRCWRPLGMADIL